ncbi:MAG: hypothetical protein U0P82_12960 [Vicinamibacterales bacterium]
MNVDTSPSRVRISDSEIGNVAMTPPRYSVGPPFARLARNSTSPLGLTPSSTWAASGAVDCRTMTPAFA